MPENFKQMKAPIQLNVMGYTHSTKTSLRRHAETQSITVDVGSPNSGKGI